MFPSRSTIAFQTPLAHDRGPLRLLDDQRRPRPSLRSTIYKARDRKLGRTAAIKVLPDVYANDPERIARLQREARVLASLNHPNIAAIYGMEDRAIVKEGRSLARQAGLRVRGVLGILMRAWAKAEVDSLKAEIEALRIRHPHSESGSSSPSQFPNRLPEPNTSQPNSIR